MAGETEFSAKVLLLLVCFNRARRLPLLDSFSLPVQWSVDGVAGHQEHLLCVRREPSNLAQAKQPAVSTFALSLVM